MRRSLGLAAAIALATAGCTGAASPEPTSTPPPPGTLTGVITASGGPGIVRGGKITSALQDVPWSARVTVTTQQADRDVVAATSSDRSGHFSLTLAAGSYWVRSDCSVPQQVSIGQGRATRLDITCAVP